MRVVLITQSPDPARQSAVLWLGQALAVLGEPVTVVTPRRPAHPVDPRVEVVRLALPVRPGPARAAAVAAVIAGRPDVVHVFDAGVAADLPGCVLTVWPESLSGPAPARALPRALAAAGTVLAPSAEVAGDLQVGWGVPAEVLPVGDDAWSAAAHRRLYRRVLRRAAAA